MTWVEGKPGNECQNKNISAPDPGRLKPLVKLNDCSATKSDIDVNNSYTDNHTPDNILL